MIHDDNITYNMEWKKDSAVRDNCSIKIFNNL